MADKPKRRSKVVSPLIRKAMTDAQLLKKIDNNEPLTPAERKRGNTLVRKLDRKARLMNIKKPGQKRKQKAVWLGEKDPERSGVGTVSLPKPKRSVPKSKKRLLSATAVKENPNDKKVTKFLKNKSKTKEKFIPRPKRKPKPTDDLNEMIKKLRAEYGPLPPSKVKNQNNIVSTEKKDKTKTVDMPTGKRSLRSIREEQESAGGRSGQSRTDRPLTLGEYFGNLEGRKSTVQTPFGNIEIDSSPEVYDYDVGHKHGGKVGKGNKKPKSRKRVALRGHRKELRGG